MKLYNILMGIAFGKTFHREKVIRIYSITVENLELLSLLEDHSSIDVWSHETFDNIAIGNTVDLHLQNDQLMKLSELMQEENVSILIEDLQQAIDLQKSIKSGKNDYDLRAYHTYEDIKQWVQSFSGNDIRQVTYGKSYEGRDLFAIEIGSGKREISVDCGIHAREWISPAYCQWFINEAINGEFAQYTTEFKFLVQPMINPDGYVYSWTNDRMWRKNRKPNSESPCIGTDLNRNYDSNWGGQGASPVPCSETFRGDFAFSAEESAAQRDYLASHASALELFLTFHSYSQYVLYPYSWRNPAGHPNKIELEELGSAMKREIDAVHGMTYGMGETISIFYAASGGSDDWGYDIQIEANNQKPLSYTFELRDKGRYGFVLPAEYIEPTCEEINAGMHAAFAHLMNRK